MHSTNIPSPNLDNQWNRNGAIVTEELPCQTLPSSRKNKDWKKQTMDTLELIGLNQIRNNNKKFFDYYRMYEGQMSYVELSEVIPQLKEVESILSDFKIPSFLKHYDLLGVIVNAFIGWYSQYDDKYTVTSSDEIEQNMYIRQKSELLSQYIRSNLDQELNLRLIQQGINPDSSQEFSSEEEKQQYQQAVMQQKAAMTPPEIEYFMNTNWKTAATLFGDITLKADRERFYMDELDKDNMLDFCLSGRCFRHNRVGFDFYKPENWKSKNTFFSRSLHAKHVQHGEYVGRVDCLTPGEFVTRYGHKLTAKQQKSILGGSTPSSSILPGTGPGFFPWASKMVPFRSYDDHLTLASFEDMTGQPMGMSYTQGPDGQMRETPRFIPREGSAPINNIAHLLTNDDSIRRDLMQVTEAYWVSYKKMYYITYETESGLVTQDIVTDDILKDFFSDNNIKKVNRSLDLYTDNPEVNTYIEYYIPEVRYGVKARCSDLGLGDDIYLDCEPIEYQIPGDSNFYDFQLPVCGIYNTSCLADKIYPYQVMFNITMNQLVNLLEKEIGIFFLFDINYLPTEYKAFGDKNGALDSIMGVAKSLSIFGMDMGRQNATDGSGGTPFNQFATVDLTLTKQINDRMNVAQYVKNQLYESLGITPQSIGGSTKYETNEGIKQGMTASMVLLQVYGDDIDIYKKRNLNQHLSVAQYCKSKGKDLSVMYTGSDLTRSYLSLAEEDLTLRKLNVFPMTNSKKRRELEELKARILNLNTTGANILDLAKIVSSNSVSELVSIAKQSVLDMERRNNEQYNQNAQLEESRQKSISDMAALEHERKKEIVHIQGDYKLREEQINALGRAADKNSDTAGFDEINKAAEMSLRESIAKNDIYISNREMTRKEKRDAAELELEAAKVKNQANAISQRIHRDETNLMTSAINKN